MKILGINKLNKLYDHCKKYTGSKFTAGILETLNIDYLIGNAERLIRLPEGAFITVSNHPYGGLDGLITIDLMAGIRPDFRFMVNKILGMVRALDNNFISVTPTGNKKTGVSGTSIRGIRETLEFIKQGHPVGFFPSGAISDFKIKDLRVSDRKWQNSILHLIQSVKVPILPLRFFDKNSAFFYSLGLINWRIRLLRLPAEVLNKKGKKPRLGIGKIIPVQEQVKYRNPVELGTFLRKAVYEMPVPDSFISRKKINLKEYINSDKTQNPIRI